MSTVTATANEVFESMTGYEELAIMNTFGANPQEVDEDGNTALVGTLLGRSMVFILQRREGKSDADAYDAAMSLSTPDLLTYFAQPGDEESGKESDSSEPQPENSLPSAS
jgi:hypothetical protein